MPYGSIAETGAKVGDTVRCVSVRDDADNGCRYTAGLTYEVVKSPAGKSLGVKGNSHGKKCGIGDQKWLIPFAGYGAQWEVT